MIKQITAAVATLVCLTGPQAPALAGSWDYCESLHGGVRICAKAGVNNDVLAVSDPNNGYVRMGIKCTLEPNNQFGWEWEVFEASKGNSYTRADIEEAAISFCEGRLGVTRASADAKYYMA